MCHPRGLRPRVLRKVIAEEGAFRDVGEEDAHIPQVLHRSLAKGPSFAGVWK